jgi:hypothetical protein
VELLERESLIHNLANKEKSMSDDRKVMRVGLVLAAIIIVVRIVLEQTGAPESINNIFGVAWLYFLFPALFALGIRAREHAGPYKLLLKDVVLFAVYTRVMVAVTYMLAYFFKWNAPRFGLAGGGNVGDNVSLVNGALLIPVRNAIIWIVLATVVGMIIGSVTLLLSRRSATPSAA